jgi:ABC-type branched-subunit amino acid transport system ATPase component
MWMPRLVLIDELSSGLKPTLAASIFAELRRLSAEAHVTILMTDQNARHALASAIAGACSNLGGTFRGDQGRDAGERVGPQVVARDERACAGFGDV